MTYGWAILAIAVIITVLIALNLFSTTSYARKFGTGFTMLGVPEDWRLSNSGNLELVLRNGLARDIVIYSINATLGPLTEAYDTFNCTGQDTYLNISAGGVTNLGEECSSGSNPFDMGFGEVGTGRAYSLEVSVIYDPGIGINFTESGILRGNAGS
jgi:hypothetical protein